MRCASAVGVRARGAEAGGLGGRRKGPSRQRGFTLVELMVVVGIISLLVTMLAPAIAHAVELARRAKCATHLNGIGRALALYEGEHKAYPHTPTNGAGWGVAVGSSRAVDPSGGGAVGRSPSSCLYVLVRERLCVGGIFICPSTKEKALREAGSSYWDFADGTTISYAVMNPYGPERYFDSSATADVPILADSGPYFDAATGLRNKAVVVDLRTARDEEILAGNSPNHRRVGQNVAVVGGATDWMTRADVGCDLDNVYTRADDPRGTDQKGSIPAPGPDASGANQGPAGPRDSYLVQ